MEGRIHDSRLHTFRHPRAQHRLTGAAGNSDPVTFNDSAFLGIVRMHLQPVFAQCEMHGVSVSEHLFERGLCLPSGSSLTGEEQTTVIDVLATTPARTLPIRGAARA